MSRDRTSGTCGYRRSAPGPRLNSRRVNKSRSVPEEQTTPRCLLNEEAASRAKLFVAASAPRSGIVRHPLGHRLSYSSSNPGDSEPGGIS